MIKDPGNHSCLTGEVALNSDCLASNPSSEVTSCTSFV